MVLEFIKIEIIRPFDPPRMIVSDNETFFTAAGLRDYTETWKMYSKTVAEYDSMSIGKVGRMVGRIKAAINRCVLQDKVEWDCVLWRCIFGYRCCSQVGDISPYEVMFGSPPRLLNRTESLVDVGDDSAVRHVKLATVNTIRAQHVIPRTNSSSLACFAVGDQVLMAQGESFSSKGWPAFTSRFMGPYTIKSVNHPYYVLISSSTKMTCKGIHARRLRLFANSL